MTTAQTFETDRAELLAARLAEVRAAIEEAGANGAKYGDLRERLAARLLAMIDRPLDEPWTGWHPAP